MYILTDLKEIHQIINHDINNNLINLCNINLINHPQFIHNNKSQFIHKMNMIRYILYI